MNFLKTSTGANLLSLTPRFSGVCKESQKGKTVLTVFSRGNDTNQTYVSSRLFASLAARGVGNPGTPSPSKQARGRKTLGVSLRLREREANSHEDHVHALIDLPTHLAIQDMMQLMKGNSSHWINEQNLIAAKFAWGRGYGVFSVSESATPDVSAYIAGQEGHHRKKTFTEELELFVKRHGLQWQLG